MDNKKGLSIQDMFLLVYGIVMLAMLYHTTWAFASMQGEQPESGLARLGWWGIGFMSAVAVDVGMGGIVWAMTRGYQKRVLMPALFILAAYSGYTQTLYTMAHLAPLEMSQGVNPSWVPFLQGLANLRVIVLPWGLPMFLLFYGFAAKSDSLVIGAKEAGEKGFFGKAWDWVKGGDNAPDEDKPAFTVEDLKAFFQTMTPAPLDMNPQERRAALVAVVERFGGRMHLTPLAELFGKGAPTISKDLKKLCQDGELLPLGDSTYSLKLES